ncbi:putative glycosyl transferase [Helicobacter mustelae 12198]|uniref:Putative glycosyl transferase n=1 Tax=Helicobacter mustelae (strain ATCC 43772 / CCUG 25715 / CIP 103759 / LMG 18044 / NCTC 12198 / R85-136P) TaxID=679897 RepID=D3UGA3_HELM1|nr:glycosyltransferase family 2 protein [Helicobacter mustelae]CBG39524.1 putative glycosyl transferase [Helicobacter mustelae 12198]SQH71035.1 glycosyl transferase [Helicobacter mustelae]
MSNLKNISVCIIAKNAERTLKECLQALINFDEVILLDNESSDATLEIAQKFPNVHIFTSPFLGFGALKNLAISHAKHDWILSIDADEILEEEGCALIARLSLDPHCIYAINRKNHYDGEWIKACGWYPDFVWRLFCKHHTGFSNNLVHESLVIKENTKREKLPIHLKHYTAQNISDLISKLQNYTDLGAQESSKNSSMQKAVFRFFWVFFKDYFLRFGWKYGYKGFVIAWFHALGSFTKYAKIYEKNKNAKNPKASLDA